MLNFRQYHQLTTPNYQLIFLSQLPAQAIQDFLQVGLTQTSQYINQAMQAIMLDERLTWGIQTMPEGNFYGLVTLVPTRPQWQLTISGPQPIPAEIKDRLQYLIEQQFHCSKWKLTINLRPTNLN
ncbi:hypothetical protein HU830_04685 [Lactobacillus sp. DCY120]|uniref:Uncharacterized protein n=1 Tax=Bombilactobacillus apium TaxID=2675299 RepID=A0A850RAW6_9LACO|nr:hypothetical protein [Bombilactobacillus apium]NVY96466.1 hypothetical protein [Bombilactobacillus apium]